MGVGQVQVLKANDYSLEEGEKSVWQRELGKGAAATAAAVGENNERRRQIAGRDYEHLDYCLACRGDDCSCEDKAALKAYPCAKRSGKGIMNQGAGLIKCSGAAGVHKCCAMRSAATAPGHLKVNLSQWMCPPARSVCHRGAPRRGTALPLLSCPKAFYEDLPSDGRPSSACRALRGARRAPRAGLLRVLLACASTAQEEGDLATSSILSHGRGPRGQGGQGQGGGVLVLVFQDREAAAGQALVASNAAALAKVARASPCGALPPADGRL